MDSCLKEANFSSTPRWDVDSGEVPTNYEEASDYTSQCNWYESYPWQCTGSGAGELIPGVCANTCLSE